MKNYKVTALSVDGREYVYSVDAESERSAVRKVYGTHGVALSEGLCTDPLTPHHTVEESK